MSRLRAVAAVSLAALIVVLAACTTAPPPPSPQPSPDRSAIVSVHATQSDGPLGDGTEGIERDDDASLAALSEVLDMDATPREDIECVWSTRTTVDVGFDDGTTQTLQSDSCGATGRDQALGLLVAAWVLDGT